MDENKTRMKREKIITLLRLVTENGLKIEIAADEICDLFNVIQCDKCKSENIENSYMTNWKYYCKSCKHFFNCG